MARRIRVGTEAEWRELGRRVKCARAAIMVVLDEQLGAITSVKQMDRMLVISRRFAELASDLEEEMFRRGGPRDTKVFFGPLE